MRVSEAWLKSWVEIDLTTEELVQRLTMAGLEVDEVSPVAKDFDAVIVAQVLSVEPHPNADRLRVCQVNDGSADAIQVVCGAPNVQPGIKVPFAPVGALIGEDFKIKKSKLRGVESYGMLCSAEELGLSEDNSGLMVLPQEFEVGQNLRDLLELDDCSIDIDLTPNRGDCLGIAGIAREVGVLTGKAVKGQPPPEVQETHKETISVRVENVQACPVYLGRVLKGVDSSAQSPLWLQERLRRSGIRSVSAVVDATNYVLLELGQPTHAFDLNKLQGGICVRQAKNKERLELLNGDEVALTEDSLVIADESGPVALAGIMGGLATSVEDRTTDLFLECAHFDPVAIAGRARRYGLHTDSSHRFERGVDPKLPQQAMDRLTQLIVEIAGGEVGSVIEAIDPQALDRQDSIQLRRARIERVLGMGLTDNEVVEILSGLGMTVDDNKAGWQVTPPSARFDITLEEDLIEELARVKGYDQVPTRMPTLSAQIKPQARIQDELTLLKTKLIQNGYLEVITYSFISPTLANQFFPGLELLKLENPISVDMSVMRPSLLPGLVSTLTHNLARQTNRMKLFETGLKFLPRGPDLQQRRMLAGLLYGSVVPEQWGQDTRALDFFDLKGDLELLLAGYGHALNCLPAEVPYLHPGQSGRLLLAEQEVGLLGALHPKIAEELGLTESVWLFEIELDHLPELPQTRFKAISRFPEIRRDIAVIVDDGVSSFDLLQVIDAQRPELLGEVRIFDVYRGKGIDFGKKSVALGLTFRATSRTLTDDEVEQAVNQITTQLNMHLGAILRE